MNQMLDFVPIALFAVVFFLSDIFMATGALMLGVTVQLGIYYLIKKPISRELKITFWASILFGSLTLIFRNELFIQWKPTIVNWLFCVSLIGSQFVGRGNLVQKLLGKHRKILSSKQRCLELRYFLQLFENPFVAISNIHNHVFKSR